MTHGVKDLAHLHESVLKYLSTRTFTKAKYISGVFGISRSEAGKLLRQLGWKVWGSKTCTNKTFVRADYEN